jgi:hypothetical protein
MSGGSGLPTAKGHLESCRPVGERTQAKVANSLPFLGADWTWNGEKLQKRCLRRGSRISREHRNERCDMKTA